MTQFYTSPPPPSPIQKHQPYTSQSTTSFSLSLPNITLPTFLSPPPHKMSEPLPSDADAEDAPPPPPAAAEDRKAAAALSHLESRPNDDETHETNQQGKTKNLDPASLDAAINRLEISSEGKKGGERVKSEAEVKREEAKRKEVEERGRRARIKVEAGDVALLVSSS